MTCFAAAQFLGGSGFIACFVGGLIGGALMRDHKEPLLEAAEGTGDTLALLTWVTFGAVVAGSAAEYFAWDAILYAVLSLTVIRMLPVFLVLGGMGLSVSDKLFLGWFGPRGLASIVFIVIVLNENLPGGETLTYRAMVERIFRAADRRPRILLLPEPALVFIVTCLGRLGVIEAGPEVVRRMNRDLTVDAASARIHLGYSPRDFAPELSDE